jgi:hypothetical protein
MQAVPSASELTAAPVMSRAHRAYVIAMSGVIGGAFAYAACDWGQWRHLIYLPLSGELVMRPSPAVSIHYIGIVAWGIGGAATGALVGAALCTAVRRPWSAQAYRLFGAWAITALLLAGGYYTWNLWPW